MKLTKLIIKPNKVSDPSSDMAVKESLVTREPISIFDQIKNANNEEEKKKFKQLLEALRKELPEGFKIGAAVSKEDCFFDSLAQGLNELKDKGLITDSGFTIKSLRNICKQYAQINQSKKDSWLNKALNREKHDYNPRIEFIAQEIEIGKTKNEFAIPGRPEIEGKIISKKYGVGVNIIELNDEDGLHVTRNEISNNNNTIYLVNYRNHFVPLLKIEKDIKRSKSVSRDEIYSPGINISTPDIVNSSNKQNDQSSDYDNSRKRKHSLINKDEAKKQNNEPKKARINLEFSSDLKVPEKIFQTQCIPRSLIQFMYQLNLSMLCSHRKSIFKHKYKLCLSFQDPEIEKFGDIVLRYENKSIHLNVENVDKHYIDNDIGYAKLFTKEKHGSYIGSFFNSFVEHLSKSHSSNVEYLVIYTNAALDLTEEGELKQRRARNFYPLKFETNKDCILRDFLFTNDNVHGRGFYQFANNETREELLSRLEISQKITKDVSREGEREMKEAFLDKLVFAVNQPNREELASIFRSEMAKEAKDDYEMTKDDYEMAKDYHEMAKNYMKLQESVLPNNKPQNLEIMQLNLLVTFLNDMFLHKNISALNYKNGITILDRIIYIKPYNDSIGYNWFSSKNSPLNKCFALFLKFSEEVEHFVVYINDLELTEEGRLKKSHSKDFYPLKFDVLEKDHRILKDCSHINRLYRISSEETKKMLSHLTFPALPKVPNEELRDKFLARLIFADGKFENNDDLPFNRTKLPYNYEQLQEIALRWLESYEFGSITEEIMMKLLKDIKGNKLTEQKIENKNEEVKFAKSVVGREGTPEFEKFLNFLLKGDGGKYLEVLKRNEIRLSSISSILDRARSSATRAFRDLYNLLFDPQGNKTRYLKTPEEHGINLASISSILSGSGANAAKAFKDLFDLWFDEGGKTFYLKTLETEGVNLATMTSILSRTGINAAGIFKDLYHLWFDDQGNRTQYLKILEREGINLTTISGILSRTGNNAIGAFKDLYNLWFDAKGNKTQYLKTLEREGIDLKIISSILNGARSGAAKAFGDLYHLWFDQEGNKTLYLKILEREGINLGNISGILSKAGRNAAKAFKDLNDLWFNEGNKSPYLKTLEREGVNLCNISGMLNGAGCKAAKAFKDLYLLWFDQKGNKTPYLKTLEENGINLANMSSMLNGAGSNAARAFKDLYGLLFAQGNGYLQVLEREGISLTNISGILSKAGTNAPVAFKELYQLWFDEHGNKSSYLITLEKEGIDLTILSSILHGVGSNAAKAFKSLYDLWFDEQGIRTQYLKTLREKKVNLTNLSNILNSAGTNAAKAFRGLYDLWFDEQGNKTQYLKTLEKEGVDLASMSSILHGVGSNAAKAFKDLFDLSFDEGGNKRRYLRSLEEEGVGLANISSILNGAGSNAPSALRDLYDLWFDEQGNRKRYLETLKENRINLTSMSSMLSGAGSNAAKAFKNLYDLWFDKQGNKRRYLLTLEEEEINLSHLSSILNGAGANAAKAFKDLYELWFDEQGNKTHYLKTLEGEEVTLISISGILNGAGSNATKAFKDLHDCWFDEQGNKKRHLRRFIKKNDGEKSFTLHNLSGMLGGAGANAKDAFEKLHSVCFKKGIKTALLNDFYGAGFEPSNLSVIMCGSGIRASFILKKLHTICFDDRGERTEILNDFHDVGFSTTDLCSMLSGSADSLEKFHRFCFVDETKKYLNRFISERKGLTISNLCEILHGAKTNLYTALKDFHDVCFDETGNKTEFLDDFRKAGFKYNYLANILSMAGNNASSILKNFHKSCFNEENYLNHFLAEKELFTPKILSNILGRAGLNVCPIFEKLHNVCFEDGNKTNYLNNLVENYQPSEVVNILYKKVRKAPSAFLSKSNTSKGNKIIANIESSISLGRMEKKPNFDSLLQNDPKVKRKKKIKK